MAKRMILALLAALLLDGARQLSSRGALIVTVQVGPAAVRSPAPGGASPNRPIQPNR